MRYAICFVLVMAAAVLLSAGCSNEPAATPGLEIGNVAPELVGTDLDDRTVRLSDYRGKVVVVDFWATWCGPCVQMMPHNKNLVSKMSGKPFAFLGVSADGSRDDLRQFILERDIKWPNIFDGRGGPLCDSWRIEYFPSIFVIDHKGVIRDRDLRGRDLERVVEKLVAEAAKPGQSS